MTVKRSFEEELREDLELTVKSAYAARRQGEHPVRRLHHASRVARQLYENTGDKTYWDRSQYYFDMADKEANHIVFEGNARALARWSQQPTWKKVITPKPNMAHLK